MQRSRTALVTLSIAAFSLVLGISGAWAEGYGKEGHAGNGHSAMGGHDMGMMHSSAGHLIRHLLKHEKEIGLTAEQVTKLKAIQLNLDTTRIKAEADIQVAERELKALTDDERSDLGAIEAKLKQSEDLQVGLRMTSIKTKREVLGLLTPEQRAKEKAEHEKMMQQHKGAGSGHGNPHGSGAANPHGSTTPHKGSTPAAPGSLSAQ
jgi:protein CpxP